MNIEIKWGCGGYNLPERMDYYISKWNVCICSTPEANYRMFGFFCGTPEPNHRLIGF